MSPYNSYVEAFTPPVSPFTESFIPRGAANLHHVPTPVQIPIDNNADACGDRKIWFNHKQNHQEQNHTLSLHSLPRLVTSNHPESYDMATPASKSRLNRRRPSPLDPRVDIEDSDVKICPCCHLRRRPSTKAAEIQSSKYIHTPLDECCGDFCPDLSLSQTVSPHTIHPHIGHSRLSQQLQNLNSLASDQQVELQGTPIPHNKPFDRQCGRIGGEVSSAMPESGTSGIEEDDVNYWATEDFD